MRPWLKSFPHKAHPLPRGGYILKATDFRWYGSRCLACTSLRLALFVVDINSCRGCLAWTTLYGPVYLYMNAGHFTTGFRAELFESSFGLVGLTTRDAPLPFPPGLTRLSLRDIPSYSHLASTSLLPCPLWHGPAFNWVCSLLIWWMAACESIILLLSGPLVPFLYRLRPYVAFLLWLSWPYMASFMATTPAVRSLHLRLPCNLGIYYLLALTAPAFAVSGRFQPFLDSWGCSLLSLACLSHYAYQLQMFFGRRAHLE